MSEIHEVKKQLEEYLEAEAKLHFMYFTERNLDLYNEQYNKMHSYTLDGLRGLMGFILQKHAKEDDFYKDPNEFRMTLPRFLFKISHYKHKTYHDVWVAFVSIPNPRPTVKIISNAFFIIKVDDCFKIGSNVIYSDIDSDLDMRVSKHSWSLLAGREDLDFDNLGQLVQVYRYLQPDNHYDSLEIYDEEL